MEDLNSVETITPEQAGKLINKSAEFIRALLRQGRVDWGFAAESKCGQWNYSVIKSKFYESIGKTAKVA